MALMFRKALGFLQRPSPVVFLTLIVALYLVLCGALFMLWLPPQPDEDLFGEPGWNLLHEGRLVSHTIAGMEGGVFWQPPFYFVVLAPVFSIAGYSIAVLRGFSIAVGCVALCLLYLLGRTSVGERPARLATFLAALHPQFVLYSKLGRMDGLCVMLILLSGLLSIHSFARASYRSWFAAGCVAALAVLTHPLGLAAPLAACLLLTIKRRALPLPWKTALAVFLSPVLLAVMIWGIVVLQNSESFREQIAFQFMRKDHTVTASMWAFFRRLEYFPVAVPLIGLALWGSIRNVLRSATLAAGPLYCSVIFLTLMAVILPKSEVSYNLYLIPWYLLIAGGVMVSLKQRGSAPWLHVLALDLIILFVTNALLFHGYLIHESHRERERGPDYDSLTQTVSRYISPGASVLAIGSPSLYWGLRETRSDVRYVADVFLNRRRALEVMSTIDFVVMCRAFDPANDQAWYRGEFGRLDSLCNAVGRRLERSTEVGNPHRFGYSASILRVLPSGSSIEERGGHLSRE